MFDGLEIDCNSNKLAIGITTGINTSFPGHHMWVTNSTIHDCGLSGIQTGQDGEYYWFLHNHLYKNSSTSGFYGSGISVYEPAVVSPYTPTAMDLQWTPYHIIINYNISHDNFNAQGVLGPNNTDGNGIILDDWSNHFRGGPLYTVPGLVMGNVVYHNGGKGIQVAFGVPTGTLIANNTAYNNNWDTFNPSTWRAEINGQENYGVIYKNNIAHAVPSTGILANNVPFASHKAHSAATFTSNIGFGTGNTRYATGSFDAPDAFSCSTNKCNSNPAFVAAAGSNNFALQAGSPAIAYGQIYKLGPSAPVELGRMCLHTDDVSPKPMRQS